MWKLHLLVLFSVSLSSRLWGPVMTSSFGTADSEETNGSPRYTYIEKRPDGGSIYLSAKSPQQLNEAQKIVSAWSIEQKNLNRNFTSPSGVTIISSPAKKGPGTSQQPNFRHTR